jgi:hypothetical protein
VSESWDVFHDCVLGSYFANDAPKFPPKPASLSVEPCAVPCETDVLARESAAENVGLSRVWSVVCVEGLDIVIDWRIRPVLVENFGAVVVFLALPDHVESSTFGPKVEATNPSKEATDSHRSLLLC